jgi:hypothetical protein
MKKIITTLLLVVSLNAFSQSKQQVDSVALWNKHLDSALSHTSIKDFQLWLYENATVKQYNESKFVDLYNAYIQFQMQLFLQPKNKKK